MSLDVCDWLVLTVEVGNMKREICLAGVVIELFRSALMLGFLSRFLGGLVVPSYLDLVCCLNCGGSLKRQQACLARYSSMSFF